MSFYINLETALTTCDIGLKKELTVSSLEYCTKNEIEKSFDTEPKIFHAPSFASICDIVDPRNLLPRKNLETRDGMAILIHSIAHIEYSAIDLALDAVYRFRDMPIEYNIDWLEVALDEMRHFEMLVELLSKLDGYYGEYSVHSGLFDVSMNTTKSPLERMAIVPRYFEASGLDVNPQIIKKLKNIKQPIAKELISVLELILDEEIVHVAKGDKWFKYLCKQESLEIGVYFDILDRYELLNKHRPHLNIQERKEAGFSCDEIIRLGAKECK